MRIQLYRQPRQKTPLELMAESMARTASSIADGISAVARKTKSLFKREKKTTTTTAVITETKTIQKTVEHIEVDADRELVFPALSLLGEETRQKIMFLKDIHSQSGLTIAEIATGLKRIIGMDLSVEELLGFEIADVVALLKMCKIGHMKPSDPYVVYSAIPEIVAARVERWADNMVATVSASLPAQAGDILHASTLEEALRMYVVWASEEMKVQFEASFKLYRIIINISGGYMFPVDTLKMTGLWTLMLGEMMSIQPLPDSTFKKGTALLAMWISMASHMTTEEVSFKYGDVIDVLSDNTPAGVKDKFYSFFNRLGGNSMSIKKYLAWNKTAGVLLEKESLDMIGAMRMMTTFTLGRTFIRSITGKFNVWEFLKDLNPIPGKRTIHDVLSLYRSPEEYNRRIEKIFDKLDGVVQNNVTDDNLEFATICYFELLKLKLAYVPFEDYGKRGEFIDPKDALVDVALIDTISIYAFSKINRGLFTNMKRRRFKKHLQELILNNKQQKYIDYFGEQRLPKINEVQQISYK